MEHIVLYLYGRRGRILNDSSTLRVAVSALTHNAQMTFTPEDDWLLAYSVNGICLLNADGLDYRLPARHLLLLDTHQLNCCSFECDESSTCQVFVFSGTACLLPIWKQQFPSLPVLTENIQSRLNGLMLVDTENERVYAILREITNEQSNLPLHGYILQQLTILLLLKLMRSQQAHYRATGIHYIKKAKQFITTHTDGDLPIQSIADALGIHRSYLQMLFKKYTGHSIVDYVNHVRIGKAMLLLTTTTRPIIDIGLDVGFNNRQHFTRTFVKYAGVSPREYRRIHTSAAIAPPQEI